MEENKIDLSGTIYVEEPLSFDRKDVITLLHKLTCLLKNKDEDWCRMPCQFMQFIDETKREEYYKFEKYLEEELYKEANMIINKYCLDANSLKLLNSSYHITKTKIEI